jgi:hypothetical protein
MFPVLRVGHWDDLFFDCALTLPGEVRRERSPCALPFPLRLRLEDKIRLVREEIVGCVLYLNWSHFLLIFSQHFGISL